MSTWIQGLASVAVVATLTTGAKLGAAQDGDAEAFAPPGTVVGEVPTAEPEIRAPEPEARPRERAEVRRAARRPAVRRAQKRMEAMPPEYLGGCEGPPVPDEVRVNQETIRVRVRLIVGSDGVPTEAEMERSHPSIPDQSILECALAQRFHPARLPDGTPIAYPFHRQFKFVAVDALPERDDPLDGFSE